jgi:hypothetical protein
LDGGGARKKTTGGDLSSGKRQKGLPRGAEELYTLREALGRGKEELDAGDVVVAVESRGLAWRLGKWPPGPGKRRGRCAGGGGGTGERRGGRWRPGQLVGVRRQWQELMGKTGKLEVDDEDLVAKTEKPRDSTVKLE